MSSGSITFRRLENLHAAMPAKAQTHFQWCAVRRSLQNSSMASFSYSHRQAMGCILWWSLGNLRSWGSNNIDISFGHQAEIRGTIAVHNRNRKVQQQYSRKWSSTARPPQVASNGSSTLHYENRLQSASESNREGMHSKGRSSREKPSGCPKDGEFL
jgi:hypothetical protein